VLNTITTSRPLWRSLADGDWVFAGTDLMCIALAALHAVLAARVIRHKPRHRPKRREQRATVGPIGQQEPGGA
jgi:hypothetical protein